MDARACDQSVVSKTFAGPSNARITAAYFHFTTGD